MTQPAPAPNWGDWFGRLVAASDPKAAVGFQPIPNHIRSMTDTRVQAISALAYLEGEIEGIQGGPISNATFEDRCTEVIRRVTTWLPPTAATLTPVPPAPTVVTPAAPAAVVPPAPVVHAPAPTPAPAPQHPAGGHPTSWWDKLMAIFWEPFKSTSSDHPAEGGHGGQHRSWWSIFMEPFK